MRLANTVQSRGRLQGPSALGGAWKVVVILQETLKRLNKEAVSCLCRRALMHRLSRRSRR